MAKVNQEDLYIWGTSGTGVPGGVISSGSYTIPMPHNGQAGTSGTGVPGGVISSGTYNVGLAGTSMWSTSGFGKPTPAKEKIYTVTGKIKKIKCTQN